MWRLLRLAFLLILWASAILLGVIAYLAWHFYPGRVLGVEWAWFAGAFVVGTLLMVWNASMNINDKPLPPTVPAAEEINRWAFHLILIFLTASLFTLIVAIPIVGTHLVKACSKACFGNSEVQSFAFSYLTLAALWIGWFIGTFYFLFWLNDRAFIKKFQRRFTGLIVPSTEDIITMLQNSDLPEETKSRLIAEVQSRGLTMEIAQEIQNTIAPFIKQTNAPSKLTHYAALSQSLALWMERHKDDEHPIPPPNWD